MTKRIKRLTLEERDQAWRLYYDQRQDADTIGRTLGVSGTAIRMTLKRMGGLLRDASTCHKSKALTNEGAFHAPCDAGAYWAGFIMADGCISDTDQAAPKLDISLHNRDRDHLKLLAEFLGSTHRIGRKSNGPYSRLSIRSQRLCDDLSALGATARKTASGSVVETLSSNRHFWRGMVDGDGHLKDDRRSPHISLVANAKMMGLFIEHLNSAGLNITTVPLHMKHTTCCMALSLSCENALSVISYLYQEGDIALARKAETARDIKEKYRNKQFIKKPKKSDFPWFYVEVIKAERDFQTLKEKRCLSYLNGSISANPSGLLHGHIEKTRIGYYASGFHNERQRMEAYQKGGISPLEAWKNPALREAIIEEANNHKHSSLRNSLYANTRCVWAFPPMVMRIMVELAGKTQRVFDPCAGWGDRLVGALASGVNYTGCDPNTSMTKVYQRMISHYRSRGKYEVHTCPVEDFSPEESAYDLAFTSPPYFDLEHYSNDPDQSFLRYPTPEAWRNGFLRGLLAVCGTALRPGGLLALNINDAPSESGRIPLVQYLMEDASDHGFVPCGMLSMATGNFNRSSEGIYCFRNRK